MPKIYDRYNFHKYSFCIFLEVAFEKIEGLKPNFTSKSGSAYYFTEKGVFRLSNHWGRAANCKWHLKSNGIKNANRTHLGYANWSDFYTDSETEKCYFIEVDYDLKKVFYQHKSNVACDNNPAFRTASETEKVVKQIRILFESTTWASHFDMEVNTLRTKIIEQLIYTTTPLQQIKAALAKD